MSDDFLDRHFLAPDKVNDLVKVFIGVEVRAEDTDLLEEDFAEVPEIQWSAGTSQADDRGLAIGTKLTGDSAVGGRSAGGFGQFIGAARKYGVHRFADGLSRWIKDRVGAQLLGELSAFW